MEWATNPQSTHENFACFQCTFTELATLLHSGMPGFSRSDSEPLSHYLAPVISDVLLFWVLVVTVDVVPAAGEL